MNRRAFLKTASLSLATAGTPAVALAAETFYPTRVDPGLFETINRPKDAAKKSPLELSHTPFIKAPDLVTPGQPFTVEVSVGEKVHTMGPAHWIEYIELAVGNEPAGRVDFQPRGLLQPKATFTLVLTKEAAPAGKVTLVAHQRCNLHGYWEGSADVTVNG